MMRQGSNSGRRPRGRTNRKQHGGGGGGGGGGGQSRTHTFDSNGPDGRVRGNARQVYEKYLTLARDATSVGDRIAAEVYHQYAEHYFRILSDSADPQPSGRRHDDRQPQGGDDAGHSGDRNGDHDGDTANGNGTPAAASEAPVRQNRAPVEAETAETTGDQIGGSRANGEDGEGEAPARPRRGRPRKPRSDAESQARKQDSEPETEDGPAVG